MTSINKAYHPELVILVVEDFMLFAKEIKHALPQHTVVFARSVEEANSRYSECLPDIIFLDLDLPDGNGLDLLDDIRRSEPDAYAIVLTGSKLQEDVTRSTAKGAQGYIIKPFTKEKINQAIETYLDIRERNIKLSLNQVTQHRRQSYGSAAVKNDE